MIFKKDCMLKAMIIDDEERATDALRLMIEKFISQIQQVIVCNDARHAAEMIVRHQPDLVFLDIRMPHISGFDLLKQLPNKEFKVIFTTAYNQYAIQAIRFSAFDYLLKPIDVEDLVQAVKRFTGSKENVVHQQVLFENMLQNMQVAAKADFRLALPSSEGVHFLFPNEVIRCEAVGNYTRFFAVGNRQYLASKTLGDYDELLTPYNFIRCHKSHLVNKSFISFVDHEGFIILKDSNRVEVSRRRKAEVLEALRY
jgi:two-component system, LytTR family, response regulator